MLRDAVILNDSNSNSKNSNHEDLAVLDNVQGPLNESLQYAHESPKNKSA